LALWGTAKGCPGTAESSLWKLQVREVGTLLDTCKVGSAFIHALERDEFELGDKLAYLHNHVLVDTSFCGLAWQTPIITAPVVAKDPRVALSPTPIIAAPIA
tara:strand:+ start:14474 stop:14779 length:306 start_codon:yes stop_codon:yes gene_type:complete